MSGRSFASVRIVLPLVIVAFALPAAAEVRTVDSNELARCAAISGGNERLACYDALAVVAVPGIRIAPARVPAPAAAAILGAAPAAAATSGPAARDSRATAAPPAAGPDAVRATAAPPAAGPDAVGVTAAAPAAGPDAGGATAAAPAAQPGAGGSTAASQAVSAARAANPDDPANFGLTRQQLKAVPVGPTSIRATVSQITEDRLSHVYLMLDNGQTWGFTEPEPRVRPGDTVTIKRAALGSFLMMTPSRRSYRVERLH